MGLFNRNKPRPNAVVVDSDNYTLAQGVVTLAVSPVVQVYNALSAFQFGAVESLSLRPDDEGAVGIIEMADGGRFSVHFTRTNRTCEIHLSDGEEDATIVIR